VKLNAGSGGIIKGQYKRPEWINLDFTPCAKIEVRGDMTGLPFADGSFEEIHLVHVFEHIQRPDQIPTLRELHRVLEPGGALFIEVPDFKAIINLLVQAWSRPNDWGYQQLAHNMTASLYGKQRYPGDAHHWAFTAEALTDFLEGACKWASLDFPSESISNHFRQEPVLLIRAVK
jgi:predicted SAM-dependent methyltransferase